jgi:hypothetical protein
MNVNIKEHVLFQDSATKKTSSALFWDITHHILVIP